MRLAEGEVFHDPFAEDERARERDLQTADSGQTGREAPLAAAPLQRAANGSETAPGATSDGAASVRAGASAAGGIGQDGAEGGAAGEAPGKRRRPLAALKRLFQPIGRLLGRLGTIIVALPLFWLRGLLWLLGAILRPISGGFSYVYDRFAHVYHAALEWALANRSLALVGCLILLLWGGFTAYHLPFELMPPVSTGRFEVRLDAPPGTPFERLEQMVRDIDTAARAVEGVESTFATLGLETATAPGAAAGALELSPTPW
jgi:hypothetical protein